jgi:hypothetical protein
MRLTNDSQGSDSSPYVRNTDSSVHIPKHSLEKLVCQDAGGVGETE